MQWFIFSFYLFVNFTFSQNNTDVEYKLGSFSGVVSDSLTGENLMDVYIDVYTGNKILKHSIISDEIGFFKKENVGYLWKPKVRFKLQNYRTKTFRLNPSLLDSSGNISMKILLSPLPENERIDNLRSGTLKERAETFFIIGNVFYNRLNNSKADRIIIDNVIAIEIAPKRIAMKVNGLMYDITKCYVPQSGKYENLAYILQSLIDDPIFKQSGNPVHLEENLLKDSVIFGTVLDELKRSPIVGAELILMDFRSKNNLNIKVSSQEVIESLSDYNSKQKLQKEDKRYISENSTYKRRVSDQNGQFAFSIDQPGTYQLIITPPIGFSESTSGNPSIIVKYGKGGWYNTNFFLKP